MGARAGERVDNATEPEPCASRGKPCPDNSKLVPDGEGQGPQGLRRSGLNPMADRRKSMAGDEPQLIVGKNVAATDNDG